MFKKLVIGLGLSLLFIMTYVGFIRPQVEAICVKKSVPILSSLIKGNYPLGFYTKKADHLAVFCCILLLLSYFIWPVLIQLKEVLKRYFSEEDSPYNIAMFRIIFFFCALITVNTKEILWFSTLPAALIFPPPGWHHILTIVPINPDVVHKAIVLFKIFCFLAMIGCFSRISSFLAGICALYILGMTQFYGKIDHYYHCMTWFMFIFASCRCADVLSVDSIWGAFREADRGEILNNNLKANLYALPLRYMWFLMGVGYFFAGFWKVERSGWYWAFSENMKYQCYLKWFDIYGWVPSFRIDHFPFLYQMCGLGTMIFETTFVFLVLFPALRIIPAISGILFHNFTNIFLRISFLQLQICYFSFVDWARIFIFAGNRLFKEPLYVIYDGNCKICRRTMAFFTKFDIFQRIVYVNALKSETYPLDLSWIDSNDLIRDMHVVVGKQKWMGYEAYRKLAPRIPLLWPIYPLMWVWPVPVIGKLIYRKVADSRLCSIRKPVDPTTVLLRKDLSGNQMLRFTGGVFLTLNIIFGALNIEQAWPFACFPTFSYMKYKPVIEFVIPYGVSGTEETMIDLNVLKAYVQPQKLNGMIQKIVAMPEGPEKTKKLEGFVILMKENGIDLRSYSKIRFYQTLNSTLPEKYSHSLISRELKDEVNLSK